MSNIKSGVSRVCITPPLGTAMSGYFSPRYAKGINDDLYATAVAFDDGENISADFPGVMRDLIENAVPDTICMFLQGAEGGYEARSSIVKKVQMIL